ncbi:MAG: hypothetical protein ACRDRA_14895 [Pseudonocardiaceae bacterium]
MQPEHSRSYLRDAGHVQYAQLRHSPRGAGVIDSPAAAAQALCDYFLANADCGDHAANDELVAEMVRRIRAYHASRDGGL